MDKRLAQVYFAAPIEFGTKPDDSAARQFAGVAYAGGVITDHPYLDRVVFDLATTKVEQPAPILLAHREPIGKLDAATIGSDIRITGTLFATDKVPEAQKVAAMADLGMPWQMSVGIWPGEVSDVRPGQSVEVNGQRFDGPLTVFRNNRIREVSFVALGADPSTAAQVFTIGASGAQPHREVSDMDQATHDRIVAEKDTEIAALKASVADLQGKFEANRKATRTKEVLALFDAMGRKFGTDVERDAAVTPYLGMDDTVFAAVSADLKPKAPPARAELFREQATSGASGTDFSASALVKDAERRAAAIKSAA